MRALQLGRALYRAVLFSDSTTQRSLTTLTSSSFPKLLSSQVSHGNNFSRTGSGGYRILDSPWSATQRCGVKVNAIHVRHGNVIERAGRMYRVLEVAHKQHGRGGAMMQVEVRDVDNGNKLSLRFGPEESVERLFVEEKSFTCLYTENDTVYLIEPDTFEQVEVPLEMFGKAAAYLKESLKVKLQLHDGRPLAASIPKHVTCTVKEIQPVMKGSAATTRYTKAVLDNGLNVQVPAYLKVGEEIVFDTEDDSFLKRANK